MSQSTMGKMDSSDSLPSKNEETTTISAFRMALPQVLAVMVKNVLLLSYGMTIGYPTILIPGITGENADEVFHLNEDQVSWIGSINNMCVPLGCLFSGAVTQPIGRKRAMQIIILPFIACWLLFKYSTETWQLYLALGMTGLFGGLIEAPVLTYVAEITQPHLRGMLSATSSLSIILGIFIQFVLGTFLYWRTVALVSAAFPIISFCLLYFVPESPHWLIMAKKPEQARKSLAWLRGWTTIEAIETEIQEISLSQKPKSGVDNPAFEDNNVICINGKIMHITKKESFIKMKLKNAKNFFKKNFLWPFALVSFIYFLGSFCGTWTLQTYAVKIFATLEVPIDKYYATVLLGLAEFVGCIVSVFLVRHWGKRVMAFLSTTGTAVCNVVVATYAYVIGVKYFNILDVVKTASSATSAGYQWIPMTFLILIAFISHCGLKVLPWILIGEVYSHETRATGCGLSSGISYVFLFLANKVFLKMIALMTIPGIYWFHGALCFFGVIILYFTLPETEGKTLAEITDHFSGISKLDNRIKRKCADKTVEGKDNAAFDEKMQESEHEESVESKL